MCTGVEGEVCVRIEVKRSGGFAGLTARAAVDTDQLPDGADLAALAVDSGWRDGATPELPDPADSPARDAFVWTISVDSRSAVVVDTELTGPIRDLAERTLAEGRPTG